MERWSPGCSGGGGVGYAGCKEPGLLCGALETQAWVWCQVFKETRMERAAPAWGCRVTGWHGGAVLRAGWEVTRSSDCRHPPLTQREVPRAWLSLTHDLWP